MARGEQRLGFGLAAGEGCVDGIALGGEAARGFVGDGVLGLRLGLRRGLRFAIRARARLGGLARPAFGLALLPESARGLAVGRGARLSLALRALGFLLRGFGLLARRLRFLLRTFGLEARRLGFALRPPGLLADSLGLALRGLHLGANGLGPALELIGFAMGLLGGALGFAGLGRDRLSPGRELRRGLGGRLLGMARAHSGRLGLLQGAGEERGRGVGPGRLAPCEGGALEPVEESAHRRHLSGAMIPGGSRA